MLVKYLITVEGYINDMLAIRFIVQVILIPFFAGQLILIIKLFKLINYVALFH